MGENRYDMRQDIYGYWTVYDIFTGQPAVVNDVELVMLEMEEADDLVDLLNREYIERRKGPTH
ncbi:hypothetical protein [Sinorhizobium fredii]|uniref:hypothetical protein n=1 Tax=Rhizobium fredii TaxID=380 RepID=UPI00210C5B16|nr:hypothetical protein [Sinorhizobium fredii]